MVTRMLSESHKAMIRTHGTMVGRMLMGLLFFFSGIGILFVGGPAGTAAFFDSMGVPLAGIVVWLVIALKLIAGGALMLGYQVEKAAAGLLLFTVGATLIAHMDINDNGLWKNLAIIGGLLYVMAYGAGDGWKIGSDNSMSHNRTDGPTPAL